VSGPQERPRKVLVFGATSAIAEEVLRLLVADGASVYLVGRSELKLEAVLADLRVRRAAAQVVDGEMADLRDTARHPGLFESAQRALGELDAVLIAHGVLPDQGACQASVDEALDAVAVNAGSVLSLLTLAANLFEARGTGVIAVIGSVAGDRGRRGNYVYGAAKSFVATLMQGIRHRFAGTAVRVITIKPGPVATPMTAGLAGKRLPMSEPRTIARGIVRALALSNGDVYLPGRWYWIMLAIRLMPERIFLRLDI
jgi:hypothetical protein